MKQLFFQRLVGGQNAPSFDFAAVGVSCLCLMHCLAFPLIGLVLPVVGSLGEGEWIHKTLVLIALPITGFAIFANRTRLRDRGSIMAAILGVVCLVAAAFVESLHFIEKPLTSVGAIMLSTTHFLWWWHHHQSLT